jgi:hypothetical protein
VGNIARDRANATGKERAARIRPPVPVARRLLVTQPRSNSQWRVCLARGGNRSEGSTVVVVWLARLGALCSTVMVMSWSRSEGSSIMEERAGFVLRVLMATP